MTIATLSDRASLATRANSSGLWSLLLVATTTALVCAPFMRTIYSMGDEGMLIHAAERMLRGATLYVDFFEFAPPGGFVLVAAWFKIAGLSLWSARLLALLSIVGVACFTHLACQRASKNVMLSGFLVVGWAMMSQGEWTQVSHHYFTTFFSMVAAWAALSNIEEERSKLQWALIAGTAAGAAAMVIPTCGALVMLAAVTAFYPQRRSNEFVIYVLGCLLVPIGLLIYLVSQHAVAAAFDGVIVFAGTRYASIQMVPFGAFADAQNFPLLFLFPAAGLLIALICVRKGRACFHDPRLRVCAAFGVAGFAGCFPRPDITHIGFVVPLVLPLLAYCVTQLNPSWSRAFRYAITGVVVGLCAPAAISYARVSHEALRAEITRLPRGNLIFLRPGAAALVTRLTTLPSEDAYFFYPYMFLLPFLSGREDISKYDHFVPGYTTPSQYHEACLSVMRLASWVVIDRQWTDPRYLNFIYPSIRDPRPREAREFERNLDDNFELVMQEGGFELRHRRADRPEPTCSNISP